MPLKPIECANCGAKYRLPETFKADHAKCKKCGAKIDVATQRSAPAAEPEKVAAAPEQAATPARTSRSSRTPRSAEASSKPTSSRGRKKQGGDFTSAADIETPRSRRSRGGSGGSSRKRGASPMVFIGIVGVLAVVLVVLVFLMSGDEEPTTETTAANDTETTAGDNAATTAVDDASGERLAAMRDALDGLPDEDRSVLEDYLDAAEEGTDGPDLASVSAASMLTFAAKSLEIAGVGEEASLLKDMAESPEIDATQMQTVAAVVKRLASSEGELDTTELVSMLAPIRSAVAEPAAAKKVAPKKELETADDIFNPKTLDPLEWQDFVTEEEKAEVIELLAAVRDGGIGGVRAKTRLEEMAATSLAGIINELREVDYLDSDDAMYAYELNRTLTAISAGINAGFKTCRPGEEIPLDKGDFNAKTVKVWRQFYDKYKDPDELAKRHEGKK